MFEQPSYSDEPKRELTRADKEQILEPILRDLESDQISLKILLKQKEAELKAMKERRIEAPAIVDPEEIKELEKYIQDLRLRTRGDA